MNLRHLEVFRLIMQTGTIKDSAALLYVSEAAVSKMLSLAERQMGISLFERTKGRLVPTPEALRLYDEVDQLWSKVERIETLTRTLANPQGGALYVVSSPSLGTTVLPQAATAVLQMMPKLNIEVDLLIPHMLLQALIDGVAEVGVSLSPQEHPSLEVVSMHPCPLVCVMPSNHPLASRTKIHADDLMQHSVVSFPQAVTYGMTDEALFGDRFKDIMFHVNVRSGQTACWFSLAGAGVAIVDAATVAGNAFPELEIRPYVSNAKLSIRVLRNRNKPLSLAAKRFCEAFDDTWVQLMRIPSVI